jgi:hypothetical protein
MWRVKRMCRPTRSPSWPTIIARAWRSRREHDDFYAAFRVERVEAKEQAKRESERGAADHQAATDAYHAQWERAQLTFRERHR